MFAAQMLQFGAVVKQPLFAQVTLVWPALFRLSYVVETQFSRGEHIPTFATAELIRAVYIQHVNVEIRLFGVRLAAVRACDVAVMRCRVSTKTPNAFESRVTIRAHPLHWAKLVHLEAETSG